MLALQWLFCLNPKAFRCRVIWKRYQLLAWQGLLKDIPREGRTHKWLSKSWHCQLSNCVMSRSYWCFLLSLSLSSLPLSPSDVKHLLSTIDSIVSLCLLKQSWCDHTSFGHNQPPSLPRLHNWSAVTLKVSMSKKSLCKWSRRWQYLTSFILDSKAGSAGNDSAFVRYPVVSNRHRDWHHPTLEVLGFLRADLGKPMKTNIR